MKTLLTIIGIAALIALTVTIVESVLASPFFKPLEMAVIMILPLILLVLLFRFSVLGYIFVLLMGYTTLIFIFSIEVVRFNDKTQDNSLWFQERYTPLTFKIEYILCFPFIVLFYLLSMLLSFRLLPFRPIQLYREMETVLNRPEESLIHESE